MPCSFAKRAIGSTPRTGRSLPSRDNSPRNIFFSGSKSISSFANRYESAIARSNDGPSFLRSAGAREIGLNRNWRNRQKLCLRAVNFRKTHPPIIPYVACKCARKDSLPISLLLSLLGRLGRDHRHRV